jgi:serine/threonine protein kinase
MVSKLLMRSILFIGKNFSITKIQRDLKPDNLLFESNSYISQWDQLRELSTLKIADFGVSRELIEGDLASTFVG